MRFVTALAAVAVTGLTAGLVFGVADALHARHKARSALASQDYSDVILDRSPAVPCPRGARPYAFTAVARGHLVVGGICVPAFGRPAEVVTLAILR